MRTKIWGDTETTALHALVAQILEYAMIAQSSTGVELDRADVKLLLKPSIKPDPKALEINKIDPYSDDWIMEAISEEKALKKLIELCQKHVVDGEKPMLCAYNARFDRDHLRVMFSRYKLNFDDYFHTELFDPMITVKRLVDKGIIKTKMKVRKDGREAASYKLEDVAEALGVQSDKAAHRAIIDTETLIRVSLEVYRLVTGRSLYQADPKPAKYESGAVLGLIMDSQSGIVVKPVKVLYNKPESGKLIVFDLSDHAKNNLCASNVQTIKYSQIWDQSLLEEKDRESIEDIYETDLDFIIQCAKRLAAIA
jgi:DNA polymerase III epsilon subunit-like protein